MNLNYPQVPLVGQAIMLKISLHIESQLSPHLLFILLDISLQLVMRMAPSRFGLLRTRINLFWYEHWMKMIHIW